MIHLIAAAGRFTPSALATAAQTLIQGRADAWGIAFCHGLRLEWLHSSLSHPADCGQPTADSRQPDTDFTALADLRTDMAMLVLHSGGQPLSRREIQPFARREPTGAWAFCNFGRVEHPERLDPGPRVAESADPGEKLFLHLLNRLSPPHSSLQLPNGNCHLEIPPVQPVEAAEGMLADMKEETGLGFVLMCPEWLLIGLKQTPAAPTLLWKARGDLLLAVATRPVSEECGALGAGHLHWTPLPGATVMAITRQPRELL